MDLKRCIQTQPVSQIPHMEAGHCMLTQQDLVIPVKEVRRFLTIRQVTSTLRSGIAPYLQIPLEQIIQDWDMVVFTSMKTEAAILQVGIIRCIRTSLDLL